jgi:hypothetical protein
MDSGDRSQDTGRQLANPRTPHPVILRYPSQNLLGVVCPVNILTDSIGVSDPLEILSRVLSREEIRSFSPEDLDLHRYEPNCHPNAPAPPLQDPSGDRAFHETEHFTGKDEG